jgi:hypothetical protein
VPQAAVVVVQEQVVQEPQVTREAQDRFTIITLAAVEAVLLLRVLMQLIKAAALVVLELHHLIQVLQSLMQAAVEVLEI